jgi:pyridoxal 5'-phosphate synthase pdxT subunit
MRIGVLAIQGDYAKHASMLQSLGLESPQVRTEPDLNLCDGLIIPGGESTTLTTVMQKHGLWKPLLDFGRRKAIFGTCAGLIVLATDVPGHGLPTLGLLDVSVLRNAYGRQIDSFIDDISLSFDGTTRTLPGVFIRAPRITRCGPGVNIIGRHGGDIVLVETEHLLAATFHPELTKDRAIHEYFKHKVSRFLHD